MKNQNQEICANCGHKKSSHHMSGWTKTSYGSVRYFGECQRKDCSCKKFKSQNQSPESFGSLIKTRGIFSIEGCGKPIEDYGIMCGEIVGEEAKYEDDDREYGYLVLCKFCQERQRLKAEVKEKIEKLNGDWGWNDDGTPDEDVVSVERLKKELGI